MSTVQRIEVPAGPDERRTAPQGVHGPGSETVIVVGSGPVGVHFIQELIRRRYPGHIVLFGDEPWRPYNRIQLSSLVAGDIRYQQILLPGIDKSGANFRFINRRILALDAHDRIARDEQGGEYRFDKLVLATGSRPWLPQVKGIDLSGVYVFRDLNDAQKLLARSVRTRRTVVVGGGLLGVEAARAMQRNHTSVILVHQSNRLMNRQLDIEAGLILKRSLEGYGIDVVLNAGVKAVLGEGAVAGVELRNGMVLDCDTVIFATGIQPNVELARFAGIKVARGIVVDDRLTTSQASVFAVGECVEHRNEIYGLLAPGLEQAAILADRFCKGSAEYRGSIAATQLKILDLPVFTVGWISDEYENQIDDVVVYHGPQGEYRKLFLKRNLLKGVVAIGECTERSRLQEVIEREQIVWPWQLKRFRTEGLLWPKEDSLNVRDWPAAAIVCNCRSVTKGALADAQMQGCNTVELLAECTGASTVCGSCKPLLADLAGAPFEPEPVVATGKPLLGVAGFALLLAALVFLVPHPQYATSFSEISWLEKLWTDSLYKQISGYSLLGISVAGILISLRKRIQKFTLGGFPWWRFTHVVLGFLALAILYLHTGFSLGENLNRYLMLDFVLLALVGALAGLIIGSERYTRMGYAGKRWRKWLTHSHIVLFWPLPVLLTLHVLSVYYF